MAEALLWVSLAFAGGYFVLLGGLYRKMRIDDARLREQMKHRVR